MNSPVEHSEICSQSDSQAKHDHESEHHEPGGDHDDDSADPKQHPHTPPESFSRIVGFMDLAGVVASTLCTVHCLLLPILVLLLPVFAAKFMQHDYVHVGLAGFVLSFCLMAYIPGYMQHHDKRLVLLGFTGVALVFFATFYARYWGEVAESSIITAGNTFIIVGHLLNRKLLAHLKCSHED